ncbi:hypothetical protein [Dyadobacter tibetensis]|uniref:hypothetical protein n=1 Tax=Dyadobacter tibetensis TaxID=1211851 RepID=UPI000472C884|nr:hypothetical protein [Dyadobacter tibetensis]
MKTNLAIAVLLAMIICSCAAPKYLPHPDDIDINKNGSYTKIKCKTTDDIRGELIAIDSSQIVVLSEVSKRCITIPITEIESFKLQYAAPTHHGWTIPVYTLATLSHGIILLGTAPLNLLVTIIVTTGGVRSYQYRKKDISYEDLRMFARFPQGIPANVKIASIK